MKLSPDQQKTAKENMGLVGKVIKECIHNPNETGIFDYKDLFQIGCIGLCKAAGTFNPDGQAKFSTYAYILIRNEIFKKLEYATVRRNREQILAPNDATFTSADCFSVAESASELESLLDRLESNASGVMSKGIVALRLQAQGYSCKEIGQKFGGAPSNNVSAWIARARKYLKNDPTIATMKP